MSKSIFLSVLLGLLLVSTALADPGDTLWTRTYGGHSYDCGFCVDQTTDGGYILTGCTYSFGAGGPDAYLVKTDGDGDTLWTRTYGGSNYDFAEGVQQTTDGGYIVAGYTTSFGAGGYDVYLVKTDGNGDTLWTRTYGDTLHDYANSVQQTTDGGYILTGWTYSFGAGRNDVYLVKTDANGDTLWTRTFGGRSYDYGFCVDQTSDGGYILVGFTQSFGAGAKDVWLVKTDGDGDTLWTRTYGGTSDDRGWSVRQISDGGYMLAGNTSSFGAGSDDIYVVKADANGDTLWTRTYGGTLDDYGKSVRQTSDGGYIVAGYTLSFGAGSHDFYLVRIGSGGDTLWTRTYGGFGTEESRCVEQTTDGGYILVGNTNSSGAGGDDVYLVKVTGEVSEPDISIEIVPDDPPVTVPQGGSFGYTGTLTNNTEDPQTTDIWVMAVGPLEGVYGPFKEFHDIPLNPGQTRSGHFNQVVHNRARVGFYNYIAYCGDYPSTVMDSSFFEIEVVEGVESGQGGWVLTGSFLEGDVADTPSEFALSGSYPNPFNATTQITYELAEAGEVSLKVYDLHGRLVAELVDGHRDAGEHVVTWDASSFASGIYFYRLRAAELEITKMMNLLK